MRHGGLYLLLALVGAIISFLGLGAVGVYGMAKDREILGIVTLPGQEGKPRA